MDNLTNTLSKVRGSRGAPARRQKTGTSGLRVTEEDDEGEAAGGAPSTSSSDFRDDDADTQT